MNNPVNKKEPSAVDTTIFLFLSVLSKFGDTVFLVGLPIHLYKLGGGSILSSTYLSLVITLTILGASKLVISVNAKNPLLISGLGEVGMFLIEMLLLASIKVFGESEFIVLIFIVPLALTYNLYASAKFFQLQDYFFTNRLFYWTTIQSVLSQLGLLLGIISASYLETFFGLTGLLVVDAVSFLAFGLPMIFYYRKGLEPQEIASASDLSNSEKLDKRTAVLLIYLITGASLFLSWETASALSTASSSFAYELTTLGFMRGVLGVGGLALGLLISRSSPRTSALVWTISLVVGLPLTFCLTFWHAASALSLLFFCTGLISALGVAIQRQVFYSLKTSSLEFSKLNSLQWIYESVLALLVTPIGYLCDLRGTMLLPIQIALLSLVIFGGFGSWITTKNLLRRAGIING